MTKNGAEDSTGSAKAPCRKILACPQLESCCIFFLTESFQKRKAGLLERLEVETLEPGTQMNRYIIEMRI